MVDDTKDPVVPSEAGTETVNTYTPMMWVAMDGDARWAEYLRVRAALEQSEQARARAEAAHGLIVAKLGLPLDTPGVEIASRISQLREAEAERNLAVKEFKAISADLTQRTQQRDEAVKERDLAVAHDRQPYPTASAYELVCKARYKHQARAEAAESDLSTLHAAHARLSERVEMAIFLARQDSKVNPQFEGGLQPICEILCEALAPTSQPGGSTGPDTTKDGDDDVARIGQLDVDPPPQHAPTDTKGS